MKLLEKPTLALIEYARNPRRNDEAVDAVAASIKEFGFLVPIVIDSSNVVIAGHTRLKAAKKLNLSTVPCVLADSLSPQKLKAFRVLDNRLHEKSDWDFDLLRLELQELDLTMEPMQLAWAPDELGVILDGNRDYSEDERQRLATEGRESSGKVEPIFVTFEQREVIERGIQVVRKECDDFSVEEGRALELLVGDWLSGK